MRFYCLALIIVFSYTMNLGAQNPKPEILHTLSFKTQFLQIKDGYNYGLAHSGLNLAGEYSMDLVSDRRIFSYQADIAFAVNYNQGIGMAWSLKPFDFFYGFPVLDKPEISMTLGPYLSGYYKWQLYPELQSGHMLWFSSYEIGPELRSAFNIGSRRLRASLSSSLAGLTSRPQASPESYFYSLSFKDFASNVHSNMSFGSLDLFSHVDFQLILPGKNSRRSIGYEFEYLAYTGEVKFQYMIHSLNLSWQLGGSKNR